MNLLKRLPTQEAKDMKESTKKDIKGLLTNTEKAHFEFTESFFSWKVKKE